MTAERAAMRPHAWHPSLTAPALSHGACEFQRNVARACVWVMLMASVRRGSETIGCRGGVDEGTMIYTVLLG